MPLNDTRPVGKVTSTCAHCGEAFARYPSQRGRYCSNKCAGAAKRTLPDYTCEVCGEAFRSANRNPRFCSKQCEATARSIPPVDATCPQCGKTFLLSRKNARRGGRFCSVNCARQSRVPDRTYHEGYTLVLNELGERVLEHRLVMENVLGRPLRRDEDVHHINGIRSDNRPENLSVMSRSEHIRLHTKGVPKTPLARWSQKYDRCIVCNSTNTKHAAKGMCDRCYQRVRRKKE